MNKAATRRCSFVLEQEHKMSPLGSIWTTGAERKQHVQFVTTKRVGCVRGLRDALYVGIANYNSNNTVFGFYEPLPPFQAPGPHFCKNQGRLAEVLALTFRHSELEVTYKYGMSATAHLIAHRTIGQRVLA